MGTHLIVASEDAVARVSLSGDHVILFTAPVWPVRVAAITAEAFHKGLV